MKLDALKEKLDELEGRVEALEKQHPVDQVDQADPWERSMSAEALFDVAIDLSSRAGRSTADFAAVRAIREALRLAVIRGLRCADRCPTGPSLDVMHRLRVSREDVRSSWEAAEDLAREAGYS